MKHTLFSALILLLSAVACTSNSGSENAPNGDESTIDSIYTPQTVEALIEKASTSVPSQNDYASMIEQCRQINRQILSRLKAIDFSAEATDAEIERATACLRADSTLHLLDRQSRDLLIILQNADLSEENRARYASMSAEAEAALRSL